MAHRNRTGRGATSDQLRDDIDRGRTGDKVPASDPAAAPLGTDDEAAGTPTNPETVERARQAETSRPVPRGRGATSGSASASGRLLLAVAVIAAAVTVALVLLV